MLEGASGDPLNQRVSSLPKGFRITSADNTIAQDDTRMGLSPTLGWDPESKAWVKAVTGMETKGVNLPTRMFVNCVGEREVRKHYTWDMERRLWIAIPNPPKLPPAGSSISPTLPGFAYSFTAQGEKMYQWIGEEDRWIPVDGIPWGYSDGYSPRVGGRYEAAFLDDTRKRIYWDGRRRSWIDCETEEPPVTRPPPPQSAEIVDYYEAGGSNQGDMVKATGEEKYFLWSKEKRRWVTVADIPSGFHRGENPNEAYQSNGSAVDRWIVWDNEKEAWVDFGPGRRLEIKGRIE